MDISKYSIARALRPFSLVVAICACLTGITAAAAQGVIAPLYSVLVLIAGIVLQAGVNLINDYADLTLPAPHDARYQQARSMILRNFNLGLACFAVASLIGAFLITQTGWPLLLVCLIGGVGAFGYTQEPLNYKARGLGVPLVFWLMGVLMICGSYLATGAPWAWLVFWWSLPVSCLIALLLLSNELRDYEADLRDKVATLAVRLGYQQGCRLYRLLLMMPWVIALAIDFTHFWPVTLALPAAATPLRLLSCSALQRTALTPLTGRLLTVFGGIYIVCLWWSASS